MGSGFFWYLAAATACQGVFALGYWLLLAPLSTFGRNRAYLLGTLVLSVALPLVALPAAWAQLLWPTGPAAATLPVWHFGAGAALAPAAAAPTGISWLGGALVVYWAGVGYRGWGTARHLGWLYRLSRRHPRTRLGRGWLVQLPAPGRPAFSFGRCVFLSPAHAQLSAADYALLVQHEQVHGAQHHSLDLLLAEAVGWFFWFNGLVPYYRRQLRLVHEYLADAAVTRPAGTRAAYGRLLLKLAAGPLPTALVHPFAARQVARRIHMLTFPPSSPMKKLRFLLVMPIAALAWVGAALLGPAPSVAAGLPGTKPVAKAQGRIGTITWQGNQFLSTAQLNQALGLKPGDPYSKEALATTLAYRPDNSDVTSRYMDQGYLFFQVTPSATPRPDGATDLLLTISEGPVAHINSITVQGNKKIPTADVLALLPLRKGELFSRAKLVQSQRALAESGFFDPAKIGINPQPNPATGLVNLEYTVIEK
ncbi:POTRA domain-containing protein [Hymenobacter sp. H14-R3]|uniref:POTRA domain-containing protein n=1 Tax=Hymenobacter sp. H14-R3 TaxID=3046308 RepID=UPI0024B952AB|nr:POTRA domain-containing protein [Hymenobacter sp. H14-R3]MDJ0366829.1 POTRA domain-containing protein [Hymenobacter sp. H14-R3]